MEKGKLVKQRKAEFVIHVIHVFKGLGRGKL